ncbi:MAG: ComF family protein [Chloroflexi bacterium]|nr:ComF family protein [Chloroflexota bacterium]
MRAIIARHAFEGLIRSAILAVKYRGRTRLAPFLAATVTAALEARPVSADLVVPVPLGPRRLRHRGFNQSELIADKVAAFLNVPIETQALIRNRETDEQVKLSAADRRRNVAGTFTAIDTARCHAARILLVDDVCTTGATLEACGAALLEAGAAAVWAVVVGREVPGGPGSSRRR